jgi:hypothetical protein
MMASCGSWEHPGYQASTTMTNNNSTNWVWMICLACECYPAEDVDVGAIEGYVRGGSDGAVLGG